MRNKRPCANAATQKNRRMNPLLRPRSMVANCAKAISLASGSHLATKLNPSHSLPRYFRVSALTPFREFKLENLRVKIDVAVDGALETHTGQFVCNRISFPINLLNRPTARLVARSIYKLSDQSQVVRSIHRPNSAPPCGGIAAAA